MGVPYQLFDPQSNGQSPLEGAVGAAQTLPNLSAVPQVSPAPPQQTRGGLLKRFLTGALYGAGQSALAESGQPTDYQRQQQALKNYLDIQDANTRASTAQSLAGYHNVLASQYGMVPITLPDGSQAMVMGKDAGKVQSSIVNSGARVKSAEISAGPSMVLDNDTANALGVAPGTQVNKKGLDLLTNALRTQGINKRLVFANGRVQLADIGTGQVTQDYGRANNIVGIDESKSLTPFQTYDQDGNLITISQADAVRSGAPAATTVFQQQGPTAQTRTAGQAAGAVASHIPKFRQALANLDQKGQLGPFMGRLNQYLTAGYGGSDPDVAEALADIKLIKSGAVRAHFGAKGGAQILSGFDQLLNPAMTRPAMEGSLNAIQDFLNTYGDIANFKPTGIRAFNNQIKKVKSNAINPTPAAPQPAGGFFGQFGGQQR